MEEKKIDQGAARLLPYVAALSEEELRRLASLVQAEINARVLRKKLKGG
jgi:hypothetical protein